MKEDFKWPLLESIAASVSVFVSAKMAAVLHSKYCLCTATEESTAEPTTEDAYKKGTCLPYTYANLVKNIALVFTFGMASPLMAWIGCVGIFCGWLALSFLAERFENRRKRRGEEEIKTDAQGVPFRCIVLVVCTNIGFFGSFCIGGSAAILLRIKGAGSESEDENMGGLPALFLATMILSLSLYMTYLYRTDKRVKKERESEKILNEPLLSLAEGGEGGAVSEGG